MSGQTQWIKIRFHSVDCSAGQAIKMWTNTNVATIVQLLSLVFFFVNFNPLWLNRLMHSLCRFISFCCVQSRAQVKHTLKSCSSNKDKNQFRVVRPALIAIDTNRLKKSNGMRQHVCGRRIACTILSCIFQPQIDPKWNSFSSRSLGHLFRFILFFFSDRLTCE